MISVHSPTVRIFISLPFKISHQLTYHVLPFIIAFLSLIYQRLKVLSLTEITSYDSFLFLLFVDIFFFSFSSVCWFHLEAKSNPEFAQEILLNFEKKTYGNPEICFIVYSLTKCCLHDEWLWGIQKEKYICHLGEIRNLVTNQKIYSIYLILYLLNIVGK